MDKLKLKYIFLIYTDDCNKNEGTTCADGSVCTNGACLDSQCHCNDGYGGCSCLVPGKCHLNLYIFFFLNTQN